MNLQLSLAGCGWAAATAADPWDAVPSAKLRAFLAEGHPTPYLAVDLDLVEARYRALASALPGVRLLYALKANPLPRVVERIAALGGGFDTASPSEIVQALAAGADPADIAYGNTIKKAADIAKAHRLGVRLFAFDSPGELDKLAVAASGAHVFCRIAVGGAGADWPLSRKFGCSPDEAVELLVAARPLGLEPWGVSFHVGSQQRDPHGWDAPIATAAEVFARCAARGVRLGMVNIGGGFPATLREPVPPPADYGAAIMAAVRDSFGSRAPDLVAEPGRGLVGDAGVIDTEVVLVALKDHDGLRRRWVYLDIGKFHGLAETMEEAIRYPVVSRRSGPDAPVVLAGPTCDSADVLYERSDYRLPTDLTAGDRLLILGTGAYTSSYSTVGFNGIAPLVSYTL